MNTYSPDRWLVIKFDDNGDTHYRVFGTWAGGYLDAESWRLNSGIAEIQVDGNYLNFIGESGSVYRCFRGSYGIAGASNQGVLDYIIKSAEVYKNRDCHVLSDETNWVELL